MPAIMNKPSPPPKSSIALVQTILSQAGQPLHIEEIIARARKQYGRQLRRESLVSALTKKVLDQESEMRTTTVLFLKRICVADVKRCRIAAGQANWTYEREAWLY